MANSEAVKAQDLRKSYGQIEAVRGISFHVSENECYGFLGPNGAGKTTAIRMIYCFMPPSSGVLEVLGLDVKTDSRKIKSQIGVVPQNNSLDPDLNVLENLIVYSQYFDMDKREATKRAEELLEFLSIAPRRSEQVEKLSGGMQRRLVIARALINDPKMLILDEPTTGLDPQARHLIWQRLRELKRSGVTMILTTHYMEEAEQLCDRIALMDHGEIIEEGSPAELITKHVGKEVFRIRGGESNTVYDALEGLKYTHHELGDTIYIYSHEGSEIGKRLIDLDDVEVLHRRANLEDVFFRLTGKELRD